MEEKDELSAGASSGLAIAKNARACLLKLAARGMNIVDGKAKMVDRPAGMLSQETGNRGSFAKRLDKLDSCVWGLHEGHPHAMLGQSGRLAHRGAERLAVHIDCGIQAADGNGDMGQAPDHALLL
jgi:hypothetical protein